MKKRMYHLSEDSLRKILFEVGQKTAMRSPSTTFDQANIDASKEVHLLLTDLMPSTEPACRRPAYVRNLDEALEDVAVHGPGMWENDLSAQPLLAGWYAVSTGEHSIIAYFAAEADALSFRLRLIDRWLNG